MMLKSLLVSMLFWVLRPVDSDFSEVVEQRSDLFLDVSLEDEDVNDFFQYCIGGVWLGLGKKKTNNKARYGNDRCPG